MANSLYKISLVERGKEEAWRDFWERHGGGDNPGRVVHIEARNFEEAIRLARAGNPGCTVMRGGSGRMARI